eukprot:3268628-Pyramimonas_sp.AAC.1
MSDAMKSDVQKKIDESGVNSGRKKTPAMLTRKQQHANAQRGADPPAEEAAEDAAEAAPVPKRESTQTIISHDGPIRRRKR